MREFIRNPKIEIMKQEMLQMKEKYNETLKEEREKAKQYVIGLVQKAQEQVNQFSYYQLVVEKGYGKVIDSYSFSSYKTFLNGITLSDLDVKELFFEYVKEYFAVGWVATPFFHEQFTNITKELWIEQDYV